VVHKAFHARCHPPCDFNGNLNNQEEIAASKVRARVGGVIVQREVDSSDFEALVRVTQDRLNK
jgi:hypothetical protein